MFSLFKFFQASNEEKLQKCMTKIIHMEPHIFNDETMKSLEFDIGEDCGLAFETICDKICDYDLKISREVYDLICECRKYYGDDPKRVDFIDESYVTDGPTTSEPPHEEQIAGREE